MSPSHSGPPGATQETMNHVISWKRMRGVLQQMCYMDPAFSRSDYSHINTRVRSYSHVWFWRGNAVESKLMCRFYQNAHIAHPWRRTPPSRRRGTRQSRGRGRRTGAGSGCWRAPPPAPRASTKRPPPDQPPPRSQKPWRAQKRNYSEPLFTLLRASLSSRCVENVPC